MKLLALVVLLSSFSSLTLTEVVGSFEKFCPSFFIQNPKKQKDIIVPTIFPGSQYKTICQRWKNVYRFATVYDIKMRIPFYSAYTFQNKVDSRPETPWKIEPQLDNIKDYKDKREMMDSPNDAETVKKIKNQAVDSDYIGSGYSRGHVFPSSFASNLDQAESTFTLTNVAPQLQDSNEQWAVQVEEPMLKLIKDKCRLDQNHLAYIVTGVVPGNDWTPVKENEKDKKHINIPTHYWSAFCCHSKENYKNLIGKAYLAEQKNFSVRTPKIQNLNERLKDLYNKGIAFSVFPGLEVEDIETGLNLKSIQSFLQRVINVLYGLSSRLFGEL